MANLSTADIAAMTTAQVKARRTRRQVAALTTADVSNMLTSQIAALTTSQVHLGLSTSDVANLTTGACGSPDHRADQPRLEHQPRWQP